MLAESVISIPLAPAMIDPLLKTPYSDSASRLAEAPSEGAKPVIETSRIPTDDASIRPLVTIWFCRELPSTATPLIP